SPGGGRRRCAEPIPPRSPPAARQPRGPDGGRRDGCPRDRGRRRVACPRYRRHPYDMTELAAVAPAFVEMAHRIVWASAATVDAKGRPRQRILHPIWLWDGDTLHGWIATG